jgi:hypothetical protein
MGTSVNNASLFFAGNSAPLQNLFTLFSGFEAFSG